MEGVDSHGRMYLLRRPDHAEIEARLWRLYFEADNEKEDYKNRLKFKVRCVQCICVDIWFKAQDLNRKERELREWEDELKCREYRIDTAEDTVFSLKRELKLKELMIIEKTAWAVKLERDADDAVRTSKENERAYEEVCECIYCVMICC